MSGTTPTPESNRRRSSRGGRGSAPARTQPQRPRSAETTSSRTVRPQSQRSTSSQRDVARRSSASSEIPRNEVLGRLLLALAVALAFVSVFASLVSGGVVLPLAIATVAIGVIGGVLFALARVRG